MLKTANIRSNVFLEKLVYTQTFSVSPRKKKQIAEKEMVRNSLLQIEK